MLRSDAAGVDRFPFPACGPDPARSRGPTRPASHLVLRRTPRPSGPRRAELAGRVPRPGSPLGASRDGLAPEGDRIKPRGCKTCFRDNSDCFCDNHGCFCDNLGGFHGKAQPTDSRHQRALGEAASWAANGLSATSAGRGSGAGSSRGTHGGERFPRQPRVFLRQIGCLTWPGSVTSKCRGNTPLGQVEMSQKQPSRQDRNVAETRKFTEKTATDLLCSAPPRVRKISVEPGRT